MEPELVSEIDGLVEIGAGRAAQEPPALPERPVPAASAPSRIGGTGADAGIGERGRFREGKKSGSPRFIRTVAVIVSVALVAFVMWWLYLTRTVRDGEERTAVPGPPGAPAAGPVTSADSLAAAAAARDRVESLIARGRNSSRSSDGGGSLAEPEALAAETGGGAGPAAGAGEAPRAEALGTRPPSASDDIHVAESLGEFADQYVVHVSSFKGIDKAREEARDLLGWGYPVFIYRVDLGTKGMWHRVYVGPYGSRDAAMEHKIKLDENPRIKSTRISKVPG
jgi:cell division septation protein DedD